MPQAELDTTTLHYENIGNGDPLLLISGLNGLAAPWETLAARLAPHFRVITHDHRGLGASAPWPGPYAVDQIAADTIALMDALALPRAHIVGHSLGGAAAQALAADHPHRVASLVLYATWPGPDPFFTRVMTMRRIMLERLGPDIFLETSPIGIYPPDWIANNDAQLRAALPKLKQSFIGTETMLRRIDACLAHDRRATLPTITARTLVLGLEDDASTPVHCSEEIAALIPGAQFQRLPYGGHNAHIVAPDELAARLLAFLEPEHMQ